MKKIYIAPKTAEVKIGVCHMVCESAILDPNQTINNSDGFGARGNRGGSFFDDDDDDY